MKLRSHPRRPSAAMLVALLALFVALGSGAYAAAGKISGKSIKNGSIQGTKLKKNTLTGKQIDESALAPVPEAAHAANATNAKHADSVTLVENADNAAKLGGVPAAQYPRGVHLVAQAGPAANGTRTLTASCPNNEVALGGGGASTANAGSVVFGNMKLEPHSYTVVMFEIGATGGPWAGEAQVACAKAQ